jgi:MFS family permease
MTTVRSVHALNFIRKFVINSVLYFSPLYFLGLGWTGWRTGLAVSAYAFAPLLVSFPTGLVNDRFAIKKVIRAAVLVQAAVIAALAWTRSFPLAVLLFLMLGVTNNAFDVSVNSLYYKDETRLDQNRKYGLFAFWMALGLAAGVLSGGALSQLSGFRTLYLADALVLASALFVLPGLDRGKFEAVPLRVYGRGLARPRTLLFSIFIVVLALHWGLETTVYSPFLRTYFKLDDFQVALYLTIPFLFLGLSALVFSRLRFNERVNRKLVPAAMFLSGAGLLLMVRHNLYLSLAFRIVHEIGDGLLAALVVIFISRLFERRTIGGSAGLLVALQVAGHACGALLFSSLGARAGFPAAFLVAGAVLVANALFGYLIFERQRY